LRIIYKGSVTVEQIVADAKLLDASEEEIVAASTPYQGIWLGQPAGSSPNILAVRFIEGGYVEEAEAYIRQLAASEVDNPMYNPVEAMVLLGAICADQQRYEEAAEAFRSALQVDPQHRQSHIELANVLTALRKPAEAAKHYEAALERRQNDPELRLKLALVLIDSGDHARAADQLRACIALKPTALAHHHLANTAIALGQLPIAVENFEAALQLDSSLTAASNNLAWLLSTNATLLDPVRAVQVAEVMLEHSGARTAGNLDTLAAAYAAAGQYGEAVRHAEEAVRLAESNGESAKAQRIEKRLQLYRQDKPYRE
jgi:spermidine synthase